MLRPLVSLRFALAALGIVGCQHFPPHPERAATDFAVDDPALAAELGAAAAAWADAGLEIANYVTVNATAGGAVPVAVRPLAELLDHCNLTPERRAVLVETGFDGCVEHHHGRFYGLWVSDRLSPQRRATVLRHELIHLIVPDAEHLPRDGAAAVFSETGTSETPTLADLVEMARHTEVIFDDLPAALPGAAVSAAR